MVLDKLDELERPETDAPDPGHVAEEKQKNH